MFSRRGGRWGRINLCQLSLSLCGNATCRRDLPRRWRECDVGPRSGRSRCLSISLVDLVRGGAPGGGGRRRRGGLGALGLGRGCRRGRSPEPFESPTANLLHRVLVGGIRRRRRRRLFVWVHFDGRTKRDSLAETGDGRGRQGLFRKSSGRGVRGETRYEEEDGRGFGDGTFAWSWSWIASKWNGGVRRGCCHCWWQGDGGGH